MTRDQAQAALVAGATLRWAGSAKDLRTLTHYSVDSGQTWKTRSAHAAGDFSWMLSHDGAYEIHAPRDYRAERDALRLRLDEALDDLDAARAVIRAEHYSKLAVEGRELDLLRKAEVWKREAAEWQHRAEFAEFRLKEAASAARGVESAVRGLSKVLPTGDLTAYTATPQWPAVGETAPWTTVWDHLQAEPRARYEARGYELRWGENPYRRGQMLVVSKPRGGSLGVWTYDGRGYESEDEIIRLPDAESP